MTSIGTSPRTRPRRSSCMPTPRPRPSSAGRWVATTACGPRAHASATSSAAASPPPPPCRLAPAWASHTTASWLPSTCSSRSSSCASGTTATSRRCASGCSVSSRTTSTGAPSTTTRATNPPSAQDKAPSVFCSGLCHILQMCTYFLKTTQSGVCSPA